MIHRMLRYPSGWEWHVLQQPKQSLQQQEPLPSRKVISAQPSVTLEAQRIAAESDIEEQELFQQQTLELKRLFPACASWIDDSIGKRSNQITVAEDAETGPVLYGTVMMQMTEEIDDVVPFHFWMRRAQLITIHDDMRLPLRLQSAGSHTPKFDGSGTAPEAFFVMLGILSDAFHAGLDGFEKRLGELETAMRTANRTGLIDDIFERRYDLLHWTHLFTPLRELHGAAKEAFMDELAVTESYQRMTHKLERIETLLRQYAFEIDTLISMDSAISNFRGNDIMRTLTIFTVLFLPATLAGTLWGSNFIRLPWKDEPWGFAALVTAVIVITTFIYIWLWNKGWTGDLLNKKRKQQAYTAGIADETAGLSRVKRSKLGASDAAGRRSTSALIEPEQQLSRRKKHS